MENKIDITFDKSIKRIISKTIRTIRKYNLISDNETIAVALSGGKDSATLLFLLWYISKYSYLNFKLVGFHVKTGKYDVSPIANLCKSLEVELKVLTIDMKRVVEHKNICYSCARIKRYAMWEELDRRNIRTIAYGHHADDAVDTFFMNLIIHSNLEVFPPILQYEKVNLSVIRPLIFLEEKTISNIFNKKRLAIVDYKCPYEDKNLRMGFRERVEKLQDLFPEYRVEASIIKALENYFDSIVENVNMDIKVHK